MVASAWQLWSHLFLEITGSSPTNHSTFSAYDDVRKWVLAYAKLRIGARFRETRVQEQDAVRGDPMSGDRLAGTCHSCRQFGRKASECWAAANVNGKGVKRSIESR